MSGHPVCRSEARAPAHAARDLFTGATWFLTPLARTEPARYEALRLLVAGADRAQRAAAVLEAQGFAVVVSPTVE